VGGRWAIFANGVNVATRCQSVVLGDGRVNGPSHTNHVSPSFGPQHFMCIGRKGRGVVVKYKLGYVATRSLDPKNGGNQKFTKGKKEKN
jgi:hypothetical protein